MSTHDAFYEAILAEPAANVHRLVYADWLDETGDPANAARADYIRLQCEAAELSQLDVRRYTLEQRATAIFRERWLDWWRPICHRLDLPVPQSHRPTFWARLTRPRAMEVGAGWPYQHHAHRNWKRIWNGVTRHYSQAVPWNLRSFASARFSRGFVEELDLSGEGVGQGPTIVDWLTAVPVLCLRTAVQHAANFAAIDTPALRKLRSLELELSDAVDIAPYLWSKNLIGLHDLVLLAGEGGVSAEEVNALVGSPTAGRLRSLNLDIETETAWAALVSARSLTVLRELKVRLDLHHEDPRVRAQMVARCLELLAESPILAGLERLSLSCFADLSTVGLERLCARALPRLRVLELLDPLTPTLVQALTTKPAFPRLAELTLNFLPHLANPSLEGLAGWPVLGQLTHLCLCIESNAADPERLFRVLEKLNGDVLQTLNIEGEAAGFRSKLPAEWKDRVWVDNRDAPVASRGGL